MNLEAPRTAVQATRPAGKAELDRRLKMIYVSPFDVLRAATNQISDVRFCEGFAQNGADIEHVVPFVDRPDNLAREAIFTTYGVEKPYRLTILGTPLREQTPRWLAQTLIFVATTWYLLAAILAARHSPRPVLIMSRSPALLLPILLLRPLFWRRWRPIVISWAHEISSRWRHRWVYRRSDGIVATNSAIAGDLETEIRIPRDRLAISLNPITTQQLHQRIRQEDARRELGLNAGAFLVVYTGKLYLGQKETEYILEAAKLLPECRFILTGGRPWVVAHYQRWCADRGIGNVTFTGHILDYSRIAYYQAAADVLVAYYSQADHDVRHNLPNKICEYMLTGQPIVTCDYPAVRDTIDQNSAVFVAPEDPNALAAGIRSVLVHREAARRTGRNALRRVSSMTFVERTATLLQFFNRLAHPCD